MSKLVTVVSMARSKPVMAAALIGETAMWPVMEESGTVEMPVFARMALFPAVLRGFR
jgi:hypothetical protein